MSLIPLDEYLEESEEKHRFIVPRSVKKFLQHEFMRQYLFRLPFFKKLYIEVPSDLHEYWESILAQVHSYEKVTILRRPVYFEGRYLGCSCAILAGDPQYKNTFAGYGFDSVDAETALSKALGEFLERYMTHYKQRATSIHSITKATLVDLRHEPHFALTIDFHQNTKDQNIHIPEDVPVDCALIENLSTKKSVLYPVQQIVWDTSAQDESHVSISEVTTSGCGGGFSLQMATRSGLFELIERDGFMCYWISQVSPDRIEITPGNIREYDELAEKLRGSGYSMSVFDTMTDMQIPSCICVIVGPTGGFVVSGGAGISYEDAIRASVNEMNMCLNATNTEGAILFSDDYVPFFDKTLNQTLRLRSWASGQNSKRAAFLFSGNLTHYMTLKEKDMRTAPSTNLDVDEIIDYLKRKMPCPHIYRYQMRSELAQKLGYHAVRVIIPWLYPLYLTESNALPVSKRVQQFYEYKTGTEEQYIPNPSPHPFP